MPSPKIHRKEDVADAVDENPTFKGAHPEIKLAEMSGITGGTIDMWEELKAVSVHPFDEVTIRETLKVP